MAGLPQQMMSGFKLDLGPLKEPLGFIRVLEWVFSIFAFATTAGYTGSTGFNVKCKQESLPVVAHFGYPFRLPSYGYEFPNCTNPDVPEKMLLQNDYSSSAEFFVSIGVLGFLYCTITLVLYLGYQHVYRETSRGPVIDLVLTAAFTFMWLVSSSAWGKGLTDVKWMTNPVNLIDTVCKNDECNSGQFPAMGRLNASVISGFLNLILWGGNCWFIYKETPFHKPINPPVSVEDGTEQ
ncbi:hypothetical protein SKAU_G00171610 [Synaphobranchus kaupii]|uniref:MARVEL domain-containing protein n=1 Tax=Synaphobranchus kaupii TaxID=118154 RepID=A0A9Q1FKP7_SYNKA|nr:hypothetical protein SKAU_G00171610 [Synaphobranchus kaupii]